MCNGFYPSKYNISRVSMGSLPEEVCHYRHSTVKHGKTQAAKIYLCRCWKKNGIFGEKDVGEGMEKLT